MRVRQYWGGLEPSIYELLTHGPGGLDCGLSLGIPPKTCVVDGVRSRQAPATLRSFDLGMVHRDDGNHPRGSPLKARGVGRRFGVESPRL